MATKKKVEKCKVRGCQVLLPCYDHCQEAVDGQHEADPSSGVAPKMPDFVIDYNCRHCGQSGAVAVNPKDIQWM